MAKTKNKTATKQQLNAIIAKLECDIEYDEYSMTVWAPHGKTFNGTHCLCQQYRNISQQTWKGEAYAELISRLPKSLDDCEEADCEFCEDNAP